VNLRHLEIFRAVMQSQTTTGAARLLQISQPAVSAAIKQLEHEVGFSLFDRHGNRITATTEAKILYQESEPMFLMSRALDKTVTEIKERRLGTLKLVATPQLGHSFIPQAITQLIQQRPKVRVSLDVRRSYHVVEAVQIGAADMGFAIALEKDLDQSLIVRPLAAVDIVCLMPKTHALAQARYLTPEELSDHPLIGLEMGTRLGPLIIKLFQDAGVAYRTTVDVRYSQTACLLASEGVGIAIVDRFSAYTMLRHRFDLTVIPLHPQTIVNAAAIMPRDRKLSLIANDFLHLTETVLEKNYSKS